MALVRTLRALRPAARVAVSPTTQTATTATTTSQVRLALSTRPALRKTTPTFSEDIEWLRHMHERHSTPATKQAVSNMAMNTFFSAYPLSEDQLATILAAPHKNIRAMSKIFSTLYSYSNRAKAATLKPEVIDAIIKITTQSEKPHIIANNLIKRSLNWDYFDGTFSDLVSSAKIVAAKPLQETKQEALPAASRLSSMFKEAGAIDAQLQMRCLKK